MTVDTDQLLERAATGDRLATDALLERHRERLRRMVDVYLDDAVRGRVAPSDVVQDSLYLAYRRLPKYLADQRIPFYPWLRRIASEQLNKTHRRHIRTQRRSVTREEPVEMGISGKSAYQLFQHLHVSGTNPSRRMEGKELQQKVQAAVEQLSALDRQVLVLRYLEQLPLRDIAAIMGTTEAAVKMRHLRALTRARALLE